MKLKSCSAALIAFTVILVLLSVAEAATPLDLSNPPEGIENIEIFLMLGQSNMKGRGEIPEVQEENPLILNMNMEDDQWYVARHPLHKAGVPDLIDESDNAGVGPGLDFARQLLEAKSETIIALVPGAIGGSWISLWQPGTDLYNETIRRARKALADAPAGMARIAGVLWLQGESDATDGRFESYEDRLITLIQGLRSDFNDTKLPFVACTIGAFNDKSTYPRVAEINEILLGLPQKLPFTACVDAKDLTGHIGDKVHYNTDSQIEIGTRYAESYLNLLSVADTSATLGSYSFTGSADGTDSGFVVESPVANVTFSTLTADFALGSGLESMGVVSGFIAASDYFAGTLDEYVFDGKGFEVGYPVLQNSADPVVDKDYLEFTVTSVPGYILDVDSISIDFGTDFNTNFLPHAYYNLYYSLDGTNWSRPGSPSEARSNSNVYRIRNDVVKTLDPAANGFTGTGTLYFRLAFGIDGVSGSVAKFLFVDDIRINGTVTEAGDPLQLNLVIATGTDPQISFPTENGQTYQLQKSLDLSPGSWADVLGQSVVGDGLEQTLSDPSGNPSGGQKAFYRVVF